MSMSLLPGWAFAKQPDPGGASRCLSNTTAAEA